MVFEVRLAKTLDGSNITNIIANIHRTVRDIKDTVPHADVIRRVVSSLLGNDINAQLIIDGTGAYECYNFKKWKLRCGERSTVFIIGNDEFPADSLTHITVKADFDWLMKKSRSLQLD